ncbi:HAD family hydrolase [Pseudochryseolinea flava]|uniref:HAD family phosphatase n=1 Tax=Pseudochryseolinea flava TaxID=2059302 RepID=A0A364XXP4_9BACT|nr:HAD family phosphatase [Pseudochryseolinea flava]RAV99067.1 HAD family phosphatase [Pseudochryseolinea flava]
MTSAKHTAFLFDLNGTMVDDMHFHLKVWFDLINGELGAGLSLEAVRSHMYGKNHEVFDRIFGKGKFTTEEISALSLKKELQYQAVYKPHLKLLPGLRLFLDKAQQKKIPMAIGSAAPSINIDYVVDNLNLRDYFPAIVSGEDVVQSKPHPSTFLQAAALLSAKPETSIVFEDAPKGVEAAQNAGMKSVVLTTMHDKEEFKAYSNILFFAKDYTDPRFADLIV